MNKKKNEIPDEVIDYCIDNKVSIAEGLQAVAERKFKYLDEEVFGLKKEVSATLEKITNEDMDDIETFLDFINKTITD